MKAQSVSMPNSDFRHAIALAARPVERRQRVPILTMVRCRANGAFEASGTDLDISVTAKVPRDGKGESDFMLADHSAVLGALKTAGSNDITFSANEEISIASGAVAIKQKPQAHVDDYPAAVVVSDEAFGANLSAAQIKAIGRVAASMSSEETRYYLNGIYIHHVEGSIYRVASTDGHRLTCVDLALANVSGELPGIIIPRKAVRLLLSMAAKASDGIRFRVGSGQLRNREDTTAPERPGAVRAEFSFKAGAASVVMGCKLVDGTFPDYSRVIPKAEGKEFLFKSDDLRKAVAAASFGSTNVRAVKLAFDREGATISAAYISGLTTAVRIPCSHRSDGFSVGFNGQYLLDMLASARGDEIVLNTDSAASPCLVKNTADTEWTGVLMPMRV